MLISPIAMLPPFRLEVPVRYGSRSRVAGAMNRLIVWVHRHPGAIVGRGRRRRAAARPRDWSGSATRPTTSTCSAPRPASSSDYHTVESQLGGIGLVELVVPVGPVAHARDPARPEARRGADPGHPGRRPRGDRAGAVAGDGARPGRAAGRPARRSPGPHPGRQARPDRRLAPGRAAARLLEPRGRRDPPPDPPQGAAAGPRQGADLPPGHGGRRRGVRPVLVPDRPLVPDDPDDRGDHRHPVGDVPLVGDRASC